jgi:hypothetical protein
LEFIPASLRVLQHVRFKHACKACEQAADGRRLRAARGLLVRHICSCGLNRVARWAVVSSPAALLVALAAAGAGEVLGSLAHAATAMRPTRKALTEIEFVIARVPSSRRRCLRQRTSNRLLAVLKPHPSRPARPSRPQFRPAFRPDKGRTQFPWTTSVLINYLKYHFSQSGLGDEFDPILSYGPI